MKKAPRKLGRKKLLHEFIVHTPEKASKEEARRVLKVIRQTECPASDNWIVIDVIIEQTKSGTWHAKACYAKYGNQ